MCAIADKLVNKFIILVLFWHEDKATTLENLFLLLILSLFLKIIIIAMNNVFKIPLLRYYKAFPLQVTPVRQKHVLAWRPFENVAHLQLTDDKTKNALSVEMVTELVERLAELEDDKSVRCIILSGRGQDFTSGINVKQFSSMYQQFIAIEDQARRAKYLRKKIQFYQSPSKYMSSDMSKPIICCVNGLCLGYGTALAASCDIRIASKDAKFSVREVKLAFASDVGSLQLLPKQFNNQSKLREYIYTGKFFSAEEAQRYGFVSEVYESNSFTLERCIELAKEIAENSPVGVQVSKINLRYSENKSFSEALDYNATWNMSMLQTGEVAKSVMATLSKEKVEFDDY